MRRRSLIPKCSKNCEGMACEIFHEAVDLSRSDELSQFPINLAPKIVG